MPFILIAIAELITWKFYGVLFRNDMHTLSLYVPSDFFCFWKAGHAALLGVGAMDDISPRICRFMYPPPFLLLVTPLSGLSAHLAYAVWALTGLAAYAGAICFSRLPRRAVIAGLAAPVSLYALAIGQVGLIVSALMLTALGAAKRLPWLAGVAAGCLLIKPQFGLLLPVCYLASRNLRAFVAAAATVLALGAASLAVHGTEIWAYYFHTEAPMARNFISQPWPLPQQSIMITVFMTLRALGFGLGMAAALQLVSAVLSAMLVWRLWQPSRPDGALRLVITLCCVYLATPYAYIYDLPALAAAVMALPGRQSLWSYAILAFVGAAYMPITMLGVPLGAFFLALLVAHLYPQAFAKPEPAPAV